MMGVVLVKNIQVIDDALNCTYDVFEVSEEEFELLFPDGIDIEFIDDATKRLGEKKVSEITTPIWERKLDRKKISGIHGTLFYGDYFCEERKPYFPTKKFDEMTPFPRK